MSESSRAWSWRHAFASSDLPATTKHVLHTLGMFMNELGEGCYPSVADICRYSGLDKKTVLKHLAGAREAGWIAIGQHGYRGQKWKRSEYVARWPERDLNAPCLPFDDEEIGQEEAIDEPGEGGGEAPPPFADGEAVESGGEGGGIEGSKVVEQLHQDKTSPVTSPDTSPVERERERASGQDDNRKTIEKAFEKAWQAWPTSVGDSRPDALKAWASLTPDERIAAADEAQRYAEASRGVGRTKLCSHAVYLREKRWTNLPPAPPAKAEPVEAKAFGKAWMALRFKHLLAGASPNVSTRPTAFEEKLIEAGKADAEALRRAKLAQVGYPAVNRLHDNVRFRVAERADPALAALAAGFVAVKVGGETWNAWKAVHEARGWPWLPDLGWVDWVYFPADGVDGLKAFEEALKALGEGKP